MLQRPVLVLGEIACRWAFGAAAWTLVILAIHRALATVDITPVEALIAHGGDWVRVADAASRILYQALPQLGRESLVLVPAIALLWTCAATVGRLLTLPPLVQQVRPRAWRSLAALNLFRVIFTVATVVALFAALFFTGAAVSVQQPKSALMIGLALAVIIGTLWSAANWFLALAPIWIVGSGRTAAQAVGDSLDLYRRTPGPYVGIASGFGLMRAFTLAGAMVAAVIASQAPAAAAVASSAAIALVYFAVADFLYIARLAAYVALDASSQVPPRWLRCAQHDSEDVTTTSGQPKVDS